MRLRREPEPDPETRRELAALDAALAGRSTGPGGEELATLATAVREQRPRPRPEFALALDLRARDGFPAPQHERPIARSRRTAGVRRGWGLALGTAASVFIVAIALLTSGPLGGDGPGRPSGPSPVPRDQQGSPAGAGAAGGAAAQSEAAPPATVPSAPPQPGGDLAAGARDRKVERGASLTLAPPRDRVEEVADGAIRVTDRHGGFVVSSSVTAGEGESAGATLDLRIPSTALQPALADLSGLAHVRTRSQRSLDITAAFRSPRRRLADALAERRGLLRQLARADTPNETAAARARLRAANRRIDRARAALRRLRERVSFAAVAVTVEPGRQSGGGGAWTLGDALADATGVLGALLGAALVGLAVLVPAAVAGGLGRLAYRGWVRRRRAAALDV